MSRPTAPLLIAALSILLMAGCGGMGKNNQQPGGQGLSRIVEAGELRIGMSGEQPPLTMTSRSGELLGLDVALGRVLAQSMGVRANFVQMPFGRLLEALERKEIDLVMSGMTITPERTARVAFVGPYFTSGKTLLTRKPELAAVAIAKDLNRGDLQLAALAGSTSEKFARANAPEAQLTTTKGLMQAIQKVIDGKVDALVADRETVAFAVLRYPDAGLLEAQATFTVEPMGIAVPLDEPRLANLVQTYLNALAERGTLKKATRFWLKDPSWVKDL
jgi:polar amino acid transport system substrate-binding protein